MKDICSLNEAIVSLEAEHGGLRAAARALDLDAGYLSRLKNGDSFNPSGDVVNKLGLIKMVYYIKKPR